jgi:hypothetical protein
MVVQLIGARVVKTDIETVAKTAGVKVAKTVGAMVAQ